MLKIIIILLAICSAYTMEVYVSPDGNDDNSGSIGSPYKTLEKARDVVGSNAGSTIWLRGGVYERTKPFRLTKEHSGTAEKPILYSSYPGEKARIVGGRKISSEYVTDVKDSTVLQKIIDEAARPYIKQIDLASLGITEYGTITANGWGRQLGEYGETEERVGLELFIDDSAMVLARWPNTGIVQTGGVLDPGAIGNSADNRGGVFYYNDNRHALWSNVGDIFLKGLWSYGFNPGMLRVKAINKANGTVTLANSFHDGIKSGREWQGYFARNILEELDMPGEYYLDRNTGVVYFYPRSQTGSSDITVSLLDTTLFRLDSTEYVTFKHINFESSRSHGIFMERTKGVLIAGCTLRNLGLRAVFSHDGSLNGVQSCDIYNTGSGAIWMDGGDRLTLAPGKCFVRNCKIFNYQRLDDCRTSGIVVRGVENYIEHNEIYNAPNMAIYIYGGNNIIIQHNHIHHVVQHAEDMGAIYLGRNPSEQGNRILYNYLHHIGSYGTSAGVYIDDMACGVEVYGNIFFGAGSITVLIGGGMDNYVVNNIFIFGELSVHIDNRGEGWGAAFIVPGGIIEYHLNYVNHTQPPYSTAYPTLANYWNDTPAKPKRNLIVKNLFYRVTKVTDAKAEWAGINNNYTSGNDENMFVNQTNGDWTIKENATVYSKITDFLPPPYYEMGTKGDEYRDSNMILNTPPLSQKIPPSLLQFKIGVQNKVLQIVPSSLEGYHITLLNLNGQVLVEQNGQGKTEILLSRLAKGVLFLKVSSSEETGKQVLAIKKISLL
ncbi:MAG: right-handed parallel beta-helix repeat-containing protein [Fibrobacteria bacterium]|nr:right-handed parallel beta-helix repeat-containing protein [Fibrobacteria bacterium]